MVYIRTGANNNGDIMYNSDGRYIRLGDYSKGDAMYNIDGKYVREGNYSNGSIMYNIDGNYIERLYIILQKNLQHQGALLLTLL